MANWLKRTIELFDVLFLLLFIRFYHYKLFAHRLFFLTAFSLLEHPQPMVLYIWLLTTRNTETSSSANA